MDSLPVLQRIDHAFGSGASVPCRSGCSACCHGPFDISPSDARTVLRGVELLAPDHRARLIDHARTQVTAYAEIVPDWVAPHDVTALAESEFDQLCERLAALPCPALEPEGTCAIYEHRPATCRLTGRRWVDPAGDLLDNICPIQDRFPGYREMAATPIDLTVIEDHLDTADASAIDAGWVSTTIAGAALRGAIESD